MLMLREGRVRRCERHPSVSNCLDLQSSLMGSHNVIFESVKMLL